jgi:hypothetical protein
MKNLKVTLIALTVIGVIALLAVLLTYNAKEDESIPVRIDSPNQITLLKQGRTPDITFVSLQPTPFANDIYNLTVATHYSWGDGNINLGKHITNWLDKIGITSYPDYSINP